MRKIERHEIEGLISEMQQAAENGQTWERFYEQHARQKAVVELPTGELLTPAIAGVVASWWRKGGIKYMPLTGRERFVAQGLEGKVQVETTLISALLVWRELPQFRCNIYISAT